MNIKKLVRLFKRYSVQVCGMRGRGKDMLFGNIIARRNEPYISNTNYGGKFIPFDYDKLDVGLNSYHNFISGNLNYYEWPYADGIDIYLADIGVYFPAQYCNELNKRYPQMSTLQALIRHLGNSGFHCNVQRPGRAWLNIREHYDKFVCCNFCKVFFGKVVLQKITIYDRYDSFEQNAPVFPLRKPIFNANRRFQWEMQYANYLIAHGNIKSHWMLYWNKAKYDTRIFKEMLKNGKKENP